LPLPRESSSFPDWLLRRLPNLAHLGLEPILRLQHRDTNTSSLFREEIPVFGEISYIQTAQNKLTCDLKVAITSGESAYPCAALQCGHTGLPSSQRIAATALMQV
jgi:hypothetical protein